MIRWFDYWLKGKDTGVEKEPAVRYYVMGAVGERRPGQRLANCRRISACSQMTSMFLAADGQLTSATPMNETGSTSFISDPLHPMEIPGTGFPGATDARAFEQQSEVRTFTTEILEIHRRMDRPDSS